MEMTIPGQPPPSNQSGMEQAGHRSDAPRPLRRHQGRHPTEPPRTPSYAAPAGQLSDPRGKPGGLSPAVPASGPCATSVHPLPQVPARLTGARPVGAHPRGRTCRSSAHPAPVRPVTAHGRPSSRTGLPGTGDAVLCCSGCRMAALREWRNGRRAGFRCQCPFRAWRFNSSLAHSTRPLANHWLARGFLSRRASTCPLARGGACSHQTRRADGTAGLFTPGAGAEQSSTPT